MSGAEILLEPGVIPRLLQGLWVTVWIAGVSVALSVPVGLIVGWLMTMKNPVVRVLTRIYLDFILEESLTPAVRDLNLQN